MANSTLAAIQLKVRRLTRSPSQQQISDAQINEYVNTFIGYDFPAQLRLFNNRQTFTFYTIPNVDQYTTSTNSVNQLFNFDNTNMTVHEPFFIGGYRAYFTQSEDEFYGMWPKIQMQQQIAVGDGTTTQFSATASTTVIEPPVLLNQVVFSATAADNSGLTMVDVPIVDSVGNPTMNGNLYIPAVAQVIAPPTVIIPTNTINYLTGAYTVTFMNDSGVVTAPSGASLTTNPSQNQIYCQSVPYLASIPTSVLYYNNTFTLRPVPSISYPVTFEVYVRPTQLLSTGQEPNLEQWWQYIAYGAAKKVLEDRNDMESVQQIMPEFKEQERMVLRTTLVQEGNQRAASIYSQQTSLGAGMNSWWTGGF